MVTHDQSEAMSISDRVVVMEGGRVTQVDEPYRLYEHPRTRFISTFVGKANVLQIDGRTVSIRPEKISIVRPGAGRIDGTLSERFFLGSQWLYRMKTSLGEITVVAPNTGAAPLAEGDAAGLAWDDSLMRAMEEA
jgi:putative spermidine/putrescine transport system ATP-binding protein